MICTKEAREKCDLAYMCEENAEVADDSECADLIVELEVKKLDESIHLFMKSEIPELEGWEKQWEKRF